MSNESNDRVILPCESSWVKLFHPRGPDVRIALPYPHHELFGHIECLMAQGWLATAPGLDEGEEKEQVGYVLRGGFEREGSITPFVLLYAANDALTWSFLKVYLNKPEDVAAFEFASKMTLDKIPEYVGDNKPQRGAAAKTDRFIVPAPKPFGVVFKKNPKHDDTEAGKMKPARLFVRWADQKPATAQPAVDTKDEALSFWSNWINGIGVDIDAFNAGLKDFAAIGKDDPLRKVVWGMLQDYAQRMSWEFNREKRIFLALVPSNEPY